MTHVENQPDSIDGGVGARFVIVAERLPAKLAVDDGTQEQIERGIRAITALNTIKAATAARNEVFR